MRRLLRLILGLVASALLAVTASAQEAPDPGQRIDLWEGGVPGHEDRASIPEESRDYWTKSINNPSLRYFAASPDRRTGAAVIIMPGGGHELLVTTTEGSDVARWFAERGVDAFVLSYRLFRQEGSPWTITDARQDGERAVRLLRSRAEEFHIDPERIGVMGFSAGGELARRSRRRDGAMRSTSCRRDSISASSCFPAPSKPQARRSRRTRLRCYCPQPTTTNAVRSLSSISSMPTALQAPGWRCTCMRREGTRTTWARRRPSSRCSTGPAGSPTG